jgi:beta-lactamase class A
MAGDATPEAEASVDSDVAFSGMSTLKIGIAAAVMRKLANGVAADDAGSQEIGLLLDYALGESNNYAANQLLAYLGDGDINTGTRAFTEFMRSLGFTSTYMQSGYDSQVQLAQIPTPGNQQTEWETDPDTNLQSTPREMGRILSAIYACTQGTGPLLEIYPGEITPDECWQILFYMTHDQFREMVWGGLPDKDNQWIVHKHGFAYESHSDVALVWGPAGPYVMSIFLFREGWMDWATSNSTMQKVSRIAWEFFEFKRAQELAKNPEASAPPPAPELAPPPGYQEIYIAPEEAP